jgi:chromosome partitioning protein
MLLRVMCRYAILKGNTEGLASAKRSEAPDEGPGRTLMTPDFLQDWFRSPVRPRIVVLGNQKGGSGKSTTAIHLMFGLMNCGYAVGSVDLDGDQATLTHFIENRRRAVAEGDQTLSLPEHRLVENSVARNAAAAEKDQTAQVARAFTGLLDQDYIVVDTPGSDTFLSRLGHALADILVTPLNDSYLDLDVLVRIGRDGKTITGPSSYSLAVLDRWGLRMMAGGRPLDWVVTRNRLSHQRTRNQRQMERLLERLAPALGYRLAPGFGERVIYRELFAQGLTVLDLPEPGRWRIGNKSHAAARNEVWALMKSIGLTEDRRAGRPWLARAASG